MEVKPLLYIRALNVGQDGDGCVNKRTRSQHNVVKATVKKNEFGKEARDSGSQPLRESPKPTKGAMVAVISTYALMRPQNQRRMSTSPSPAPHSMMKSQTPLMLSIWVDTARLSAARTRTNPKLRRTMVGPEGLSLANRIQTSFIK